MKRDFVIRTENCVKETGVIFSVLRVPSCDHYLLLLFPSLNLNFK